MNGHVEAGDSQHESSVCLSEARDALLLAVLRGLLACMEMQTGLNTPTAFGVLCLCIDVIHALFEKC